MNVCLLGDALVSTEKSITGYGVAVDLLLSNILKTADYDKLYLLCEKDTYHYERVIEIKKTLSSDKQKRIHIVDEYDLFLHGTNRLEDVDVIHSLQADALKAMYLRNELNRNIPIVLTMHGLSEQRLYMYLYIPLLIGSFRSYDAIICTSEAVRDVIVHIFDRLTKQFSQYVKNKPQILLKKIPLGVDTEYFKPVDRTVLRKRWNVGTDTFVILWFGRLSKNHKADLSPLLKVFSNLVKENSDRDLLLMIAGSSSDGLYEKEILEIAESLGILDSVRMICANEVYDRNELYNVCDVFTSPVDNIQETFGITPIEAMAAGTAQVVSDWDGYRDTVQDGLTGYRIPTYWMQDCLEDMVNRDFLPLNDMHRRDFYSFLEIESVAVDMTVYQERLQRLIDSPALLQYFRKMSRNRALEVFEISHVIKQIESLWDELIAGARSERTSAFKKLHLTDYCQDFEGYPSKMLDDETQFVVSESYHSWKEEIKPTLDISETQISEMKKMLLSSSVLSVNSISVSCTISNRALVRRVLMYFLKNGLIEMKKEEKMNKDVILVDDSDRIIGYDSKLCAHYNGKKHRALSVFVLDENGEKIILQKRSNSKYHSGGLWSNSCCTHQYKGETILEAVNRCLKDELGISEDLYYDLKEIGSFSYFSDYGEMKENEYDHVYVCKIHLGDFSQIRLNPDEVQEIKCVELSEVRAIYHEKTFTSWFIGAFHLLEEFFNLNEMIV